MKAPLLSALAPSLMALALMVLAPSAHAQDVVTQPKPGAAEPPREWIDKDTGHRVIRLSDKPGSGSLYFNFNGYTPDGSMLMISTPDGISAVDLKTHALKPIVDGKVRLLFVGRKTGQVYYQRTAEDGTGAV